MLINNRRSNLQGRLVPLSDLVTGALFSQDNSTLMKVTIVGRTRDILTANSPAEYSDDCYGVALATGRVYALKPSHKVVPVMHEPLDVLTPIGIDVFVSDVSVNVNFKVKGTYPIFKKVEITGFLTNSKLYQSISKRDDAIVINVATSELSVLRGDVKIELC